MARPTKKNNKTARLNLALLPELKSSIEKLSAIDEISSNALIEQVLSAYVAGRKSEVDEYDAALKKIRDKAAKKDLSKVNQKKVSAIKKSVDGGDGNG